jgi:hypothetical protein
MRKPYPLRTSRSALATALHALARLLDAWSHEICSDWGTTYMQLERTQIVGWLRRLPGNRYRAQWVARAIEAGKHWRDEPQEGGGDG